MYGPSFAYGVGKSGPMTLNTTSFMYMYNVRLEICETHASWGVACSMQNPRRDNVVLRFKHMFFCVCWLDEP